MVDEKNVNTDQLGMSDLGIYVIGKRGTSLVDGKIYTVYDEPFVISELKCKSFMQNLVNTPGSDYYYDHDDKFLFKIGSINSNNMMVHQCLVPEVIQPLTNYISNSLRKYHQTIHALNYMPQGYYKMSKEQKEDIQQRIDDAIIDYVTKYVLPDIDVSDIKPSIKSSPDFKDALNKLIDVTKSAN